MHYKQYKNILSPENGMNIYRGCSHGCIYCDSRSKCYQMDHDFEDIEVKKDAPKMLEAALLKKRQKCMIGTGSMTDSYLPLESTLEYTRQCLQVIDKLGFGLSILTKSNRILRDLDLLKSINAKAKCIVQITLTTFDEQLCKILEPHVSSTIERFQVLKTLHDNEIETIVWMCPMLPYINDTEENMRGLLQYCIEAKVYGIIFFGVGMTLREGDREYYYQKLDEHFPGLKQKYQQKYGDSYVVMSEHNERLSAIFYEVCQKNGIETDANKLFERLRTFPNQKKVEQLSLF